MCTGACFAEDILLYVHIRVITVSEAEIAVIDIVIDIAIQWDQILYAASFRLVSKSHLARERVKEMPPPVYRDIAPIFRSSNIYEREKGCILEI